MRFGDPLISVAMLNDPAFKTLSVCAVILFFKMFGVGTYTALVRRKVGTTLNPEDQKTLGGKLVEIDPPEVQRVQRAHRNDMENIPVFLSIAILAVLAGVNRTGQEICVIGFTVARIAHSITYLRGMSPWRSISFGSGALASAALMIMLLIRVLGA